MKTFALLFLLSISVSCRSDKESLKKELVLAAETSDFWVKVHAVEYLIALDYLDEAIRITSSDLKGYEEISQKRIGYWRCAYRLAESEALKSKYLAKIIAAYSDSTGTDRIHAVETLAKLKYPLRQVQNQQLVIHDLASADPILSAFTAWAYCNSDDRPDVQPLIDSLQSEDPVRRKLMGYALSFYTELDANQWNVLASAALNEDEASDAKPYLLNAAYCIYYQNNIDKPIMIRALTDVMDTRFLNNTKNDRIEICRSYAIHASDLEMKRLEDYVQEKKPIINNNKIDTIANLDVKISAIYAIINHRKP